MKRTATALTALILAASAGTAFANTAPASYNTTLVPSSVLYESPANDGIKSDLVAQTTGTAQLKSAASLLSPRQQVAENLSANDQVNVTVFPRADAPLNNNQGR